MKKWTLLLLDVLFELLALVPVKKWKALALGILFPVLSISLLIPSRDPAALWFALPGVLLLGVWYGKFNRDRNIVAQAQLESRTATYSSAPIQTTSEGSSASLFVPDPLKD